MPRDGSIDFLFLIGSTYTFLSVMQPHKIERTRSVRFN